MTGTGEAGKSASGDSSRQQSASEDLAATVYAVKPPRGRVVHLHKRGYQPARLRPQGNSSALCNVGIWPSGNPPQQHAMVSLIDALKWTAMEPNPNDPRPSWVWCRHCLGHLVVLAGLEKEMVTQVVNEHG